MNRAIAAVVGLTMAAVAVAALPAARGQTATETFSPAGAAPYASAPGGMPTGPAGGYPPGGGPQGNPQAYPQGYPQNGEFQGNPQAAGQDAGEADTGDDFACRHSVFGCLGDLFCHHGEGRGLASGDHTWYFPGSVTAEGVFLFRQPAAPLSLAQDFLTGNDVLNAHDCPLGMGAGFEVTGTAQLGWSEIEAIGLVDDDWSETRTAVANNNSLLVVPIVDNTGNYYDSLTAVYTSQLYNGEINLRKQVADGFTGLIGARFLALNESLLLTATQTTVPGMPTASQHEQTYNNLFGFQIGGDWQFGYGFSPVWLDTVFKGGVYANEVRTTQTNVNQINATSTAIGSTTGQASFIGEVSSRAIWQVNQRINLYVGYRVMWINGVALAPDNIATSPFVATNSSDAVFIHGASGGVQVTW